MRLQLLSKCLVSLPFGVLLTGCNPEMFVAESAYAPQLRAAGDFEVTAGAKIRFTSAVLAPEFNAAISPLPHLGLMGSYRRDFRATYPSMAGHHYSRNPVFQQELTELGAGTYHTFPFGLHLAAYGGYAWGWIQRRDHLLENTYRQWRDDIDAEFHRQWIQASCSFTPPEQKGKLVLGAGFKYSRQYFDVFRNGRNIPIPADYSGTVISIPEGFGFVRISPGGHQLLFQIGVAQPDERYYRAETSYSYYYINLNYCFSRSFRKRQHTPQGFRRAAVL